MTGGGPARALALAAMVACAAPALGDTTALEPLTRRDQLLGFEGVGRIDIGPANGDGGFCTGSLVSTTLVLTAPHCVFDRQGRPLDPATLTFRAGYVEGQAIASVGVARTVAHPGYEPTAPVSQDTVRHDVALLELAQAIPAAVAAPYAIRAPGTGDAVSVVSYAQGREEALSWQRECQVVGRTVGLIATNCDVTFGASGAPVFDRSGGGRARIVSIISAGGEIETGEVISYGMDLPQAVDDLKALLARDQPLAVAAPQAAAKPKVRRLGASDGTSRDIGARFVTP